MNAQIYKITFDLLEKDFKDLENLSKEKNMKIADLVRLSLSNYVFMNNAVENGGNILIVDKDEIINKIIFK